MSKKTFTLVAIFLFISGIIYATDFPQEPIPDSSTGGTNKEILTPSDNTNQNTLNGPKLLAAFANEFFDNHPKNHKKTKQR